MNKAIYIPSLLTVITLMSCSDNSVEEVIKPNNDLEPFPTGEAIAVDATLSTVGQTRAVGKTFAPGDELLAYVEAGKMVDKVFTPVVRESGFDQSQKSLFSKLLTFTISADPEGTLNNQPIDGYNNITMSQYFDESYYWDDFSTMTYDLRSTNPQRGIRLKYGYCYNGGTPSKGLTENSHTEADGIIEWTVQTDQTVDNAIMHSDLLMASTQTMITYKHDNSQNERGVLKMPFTHAMSQFTIEIVCGSTFADPATALANTTIDLHHVQAKCTVNAPTGTVTHVDKNTSGAVLGELHMHPENAGTNIKRFTAIVAPTNLTVGNILAKISEVAGIPYQIDVTENLLSNAPAEKQNWLSQLVPDDEDVQNGVAQSRPQTRASEHSIGRGTGYRTKSGVNYKLVVTVNKQKIDVYATIADWVEVEAQTAGKIEFTNDITKKCTTDLGTYTWFDVFRAKEANPTNPTVPKNYQFDEDNDNAKIDRATTYTKSGTTWSNSPEVFWPNATDYYYFRALGSNLSKDVVYNAGQPLVTSSAQSGSDYITIKNGATNNNDMIWGTTEQKNGYNEGAAIAPRTGDVPLTFKHILSKVSFILKTSDDAAQSVDLDGAKIQISNIYNECYLNLATGAITTPGSIDYLYKDNDNTIGRATTYNSTDKIATLSNQIVTPQTIEDDAMLVITLKDGTTYKAKLKLCEATDSNGVSTGSKIGAWAQGQHYTYTITLSKEKATLRAVIQDWIPASGSGNATLDWD